MPIPLRRVCRWRREELWQLRDGVGGRRGSWYPSRSMSGWNWRWVWVPSVVGWMLNFVERKWTKLEWGWDWNDEEILTCWSLLKAFCWKTGEVVGGRWCYRCICFGNWMSGWSAKERRMPNFEWLQWLRDGNSSWLLRMWSSLNVESRGTDRPMEVLEAQCVQVSALANEKSLGKLWNAFKTSTNLDPSLAHWSCAIVSPVLLV